MKIIIENGGSKLDWLILGENHIYSSNGINILDNDDKVLLQIKSIFHPALSSEEHIEIDFYTAGLTNISKHRLETLFSQSFNINSINIFSDILAASRALFKDQHGIACILGTGSNCAYFDGLNNHIITYSTGYLLGDEGSGYDLGRSFLKLYFQDNMPLEMKTIFENHTQMSRSELLGSIYNSQNPKFYIASFSRFLKDYDKNSFIEKIITDSLLSFLENHPFKYTGFNKLKFGFVGSVAFNF